MPAGGLSQCYRLLGRECGLPGWTKKPGPLDHHLALDHVLVSVKCDEGASSAWAARAIETARG